MNKKGFLLIDSLVCLLITVSMSILCVFTFNQLNHFENTYKLYYEHINEDYENIYLNLEECVKCQILETEEELDF